MRPLRSTTSYDVTPLPGVSGAPAGSAVRARGALLALPFFSPRRPFPRIPVPDPRPDPRAPGHSGGAAVLGRAVLLHGNGQPRRVVVGGVAAALRTRHRRFGL